MYMKSEKCLSIKMEDENLFVGEGGGTAEEWLVTLWLG